MTPLSIAFLPHLNELTGAPLTHVHLARTIAARPDTAVRVILPSEGPLTALCADVGLRAEIVENPPGGIAEKKGLVAKLGHLLSRHEAKNRLAEHLAANRVDVLYAASAVSVVAAIAAKESGTALAYHLQEPPSSFPDTPANRKKAQTIREAASILFYAPGSHLALFGDLATDAGEGAPGRPAAVRVNNAVDAARIAGLDRAACRRAMCEEFGFDPAGTIVVTVASITHRKGIDLLWEAAYDLLFRWRKLHFLVVGPDGADAEFVAHVKNDAASSDFATRFRFAGPRADVAPFLRGADLFALPTRDDAQPLAILEAMAAGLPIVTTDVGDIPHLLKEGEIAFLHPAGDPQPVQEGIEKILSVADVRERYTRGVVARAAAFTYDAAADVVLDALRRMRR